jgi:hypothetical protein
MCAAIAGHDGERSCQHGPGRQAPDHVQQADEREHSASAPASMRAEALSAPLASDDIGLSGGR